MDLSNQSCLSGRPTVWHGKNFNVEHYAQTFQPHYVLPMLICTIDGYHCYPHSEIIILAGGHQVSENQNRLALFFRTFLTHEKLNMVLKQFKLNVMIPILSKLY